MRLYKILPNLFVSGVPKEKDVETLAKDGITAIVTMSKKKPEPVVLAGKKHFYFPIPDGKTLPDFQPAIDKVEELLADGETVLVHCLQGRNRSMMVAATVMKDKLQLSGEEAFQRVRAIRSSCLHNILFEEHLRNQPRRTA